MIMIIIAFITILLWGCSKPPQPQQNQVETTSRNAISKSVKDMAYDIGTKEWQEHNKIYGEPGSVCLLYQEWSDWGWLHYLLWQERSRYAVSNPELEDLVSKNKEIARQRLVQESRKVVAVKKPFNCNKEDNGATRTALQISYMIGVDDTSRREIVLREAKNKVATLIAAYRNHNLGVMDEKSYLKMHIELLAYVHVEEWKFSLDELGVPADIRKDLGLPPPGPRASVFCYKKENRPKQAFCSDGYFIELSHVAICNAAHNLSFLLFSTSATSCRNVISWR